MPTPTTMRELVLPTDTHDADHRLDSPAFHRNGLPIVDALAARLSGAEGHVLEIGSGSGQHVVLFARSFPQLTFWPSDPNAAHRASIDAWRDHIEVENVRPAADLDVRAQDWGIGPERPPFRAAVCANVIHIAPWTVAEGLFRGAARHLAASGFLALYGPFRWHGSHISEGNQAFDANLRARDPSWGVRDVDDVDRLAATHRLQRVETVATPANNHLLFFARDNG